MRFCAMAFSSVVLTCSWLTTSWNVWGRYLRAITWYMGWAYARPRVIRGTRTAPLPLLPSGPGGVCGRPLHGARDLTSIYRSTRAGEDRFAFARRLREGRAANRLQRAEVGKTAGGTFDGCSDGFEVGGVVVNQRHAGHQGSRGNHHIEAPSDQSFLAGLDEFVGTAGRRRRVRKEGHDFTGDDGDGAIERPHSPEAGKIGDAGGFDLLGSPRPGALPQQRVPADSLHHGHGGDMHGMAGKILGEPAFETRFAGARQPTFGASVEEERTPSRIDHRLTPASCTEDHSVQHHQLVVGERSKSALVERQDLLAALCLGVPAQAFGEGFGNHGAEVAVAGAGDAFRLGQRIRRNGHGGTALRGGCRGAARLTVH